MSAFTPEQIAALRAPLSREHVKERKQAGRQVAYIEGWLALAEANRIFGFDAWSSETVECRCVSEKACVIGAGGQYEKPGFRVAYVGKVRVTVYAGDRAIVREGTGYGSGIDADVGEAHESAAKECETDARKRALMTFGNPFGLALYDKTQAEVEPAQGQRRPAPAAGARNAGPPSRALESAPPISATPPLPPHPEETGEMAERRRIRALIDKYDSAIKAAPHKHALELVMDDGREDMVEIEKAGPQGIEAARKLRDKAMRKMAQFEERAA